MILPAAEAITLELEVKTMKKIRGRETLTTEPILEALKSVRNVVMADSMISSICD